MARGFGHEDAGLATPESLARIVRNYNIDLFLDTNDKRYIVGPKGSGKTLLLLRKAIDQRRQGDGICIPSDAKLPVDRMTAAQHVGRTFHYRFKDPSENSLAWTAVWKHAFFRSILDHLREQLLAETPKESGGDSWRSEFEASRLMQHRQIVDRLVPFHSLTPQRPFHYFTELGAELDSKPVRVLKRVREEVRLMDGLLQPLRTDIYVFLDNLDDYYECDPELWFNSIYGQFRAVREITLTHRNVHLFTSIRQDVYTQFRDEMMLQYYDYVTHLGYKRRELLCVFEAGIQGLDDDLLMVPDCKDSDPWRAFFGDCVKLPNGFVGEEEDIRQYLLRHTLGRPRDLVHLGTVLLEERPPEGFHPDSVHHAVARAHEYICEQYIREVTPMLDPRFDVKEFVSAYVPSNVLSSKQLEMAAQDFMEHRTDASAGDMSDLNLPFETLYEMGFLGFAERKLGGRDLVQKFRMPGCGLRPPAERRVPDSDLYFLHPVLDHILPKKLKNDRMIVGHHYPVREP